jgi:hypothetical protein
MNHLSHQEISARVIHPARPEFAVHFFRFMFDKLGVKYAPITK